MKKLLVCLGIFLLINTSAFSQGYKKASVAEIKKKLIGKTVRGNSTVLTFNKNGTLKGVWQGSSGATTISGKFTLSKKGYCRTATMVMASGKIVNRANECFDVSFKGNKKVKIGKLEYTIQK